MAEFFGLLCTHQSLVKLKATESFIRTLIMSSLMEAEQLMSQCIFQSIAHNPPDLCAVVSGAGKHESSSSENHSVIQLQCQTTRQEMHFNWSFSPSSEHQDALVHANIIDLGPFTSVELHIRGLQFAHQVYDLLLDVFGMESITLIPLHQVNCCNAIVLRLNRSFQKTSRAKLVRLEKILKTLMQRNAYGSSTCGAEIDCRIETDCLHEQDAQFMVNHMDNNSCIMLSFKNHMWNAAQHVSSSFDPLDGRLRLHFFTKS